VEVRIRLVHLVLVALAATFGFGLLVGHYVLGSRDATTPPEAVLQEAQTPAFRRNANESEAQANVRAAVPGLEAWNADHAGGYAGATLEHLQASYDAGIRDVDIVVANSATYCVQSTVGEATYHKAGPASDIVSGPCPGR